MQIKVREIINLKEIVYLNLNNNRIKQKVILIQKKEIKISNNLINNQI